MKVKVFAKLNLTLYVSAKQGKFHPLDSVATSVDICDVVEVTVRSDDKVAVNDLPRVAAAQNSAYRAAVAFQETFSTTGVEISVRKGIPFGGGLGGSSADAAAVVYCMCKLFGVDICSQRVHQLCAKLGSDVNFMLFGGLGRMQGKGDDVTFYKLAKSLCFALTTFDCSMSSGEVYSAFDKLSGNKRSFSTPYSRFAVATNDECVALLGKGDNEQAIRLFSNDLQQATITINDYADRYIKFIRDNGLVGNMTGSGSAYFVACATQDEADRVTCLLNAHGFTTTVCASIPSGIVET